eukprot:TRINITY_DN11402_c0_g1_i1.p1 TRINITY_DN11402_c0_g1~~TRINITY_DN11402_c0_g1_i1.p1  ORF type:complete len:193 (+),score=22.37 TRINITY_DN11402_c0_g1_i1:383-961(+)
MAACDNGLFETSELTIDALRPGDAEALFAYRGDPSVSRFQGWQPTSLTEAAEFIAIQQTVAFATAGTWCQRAIRLRGSGELVGDLGLHFPDDSTGSVELGITLAPGHRGRGYARMALTAALDVVFGRLNYHRVVASVDPRNADCVALLRKLGLRQEAHHVQSLYCRGEWIDDLVFAMLRSEWRPPTPVGTAT